MKARVAAATTSTTTIMFTLRSDFWYMPIVSVLKVTVLTPSVSCRASASSAWVESSSPTFARTVSAVASSPMTSRQAAGPT